MVGERLVVDVGLDLGQQAADAAGLARFGCRAVLAAAPAPRVPGAWTFGDHGVVESEPLASQSPDDNFYKQQHTDIKLHS